MDARTQSIVIDPRKYGVNINGEYRLSVRWHGKRLAIDVEKIGEVVVLTAEKLDSKPPFSDTSVTN